MRKNAVLALVFLAAACGSYQFPGGPAARQGTVSGHVVSRPCPPVEQADKVCAGRPVSGVEIAYLRGETTAKTVTDSNGNYTVQLAAGTWTVHLNTYMRIISGPTEVNVTAGSTMTADYILDSGIRVPAPQQ
jgi:type 1 fimbria pilin